MAFWNPFSRFSRNTQSNEKRTSNVQNNPNYQYFSNLNQDIQKVIDSKSVVSRNVQEYNRQYANPTWQTFFADDILAMPLATNKNERIAQYRKIAAYSLCNWCLDEIADDIIHADEDEHFITMKLPSRLNATQQDILQNEFEKYINLFKFDTNGYNLIKRFLIEGELAWENVINPNMPDLGIIGVKFLPAEYYETLIDTKTSQPVGIVFDTEKFSKDKRDQWTQSFVGSAGIFNSLTPVSYAFTFRKETCIPLLWSQVTYINSGEYSYDYLVSYPLIEKAKQAYHRLALMEESAIILRVTRAPERLLFNVSTGKMNQNYADDYVRRFAQSLMSKKTPIPGEDGDIAQTYNPVTMMKSYVFGKSDDSNGTSVESVGSSASYDELGDIEYFLRQFLKYFKIPFSRYKTPENTMEKNDSISYEEYSFSRLIIRIQRRIAEGLKRGFITHLKLRGLWDKENYELKESDLKISMMKPVLYDLYESQKQAEAKMSIYKTYADQDELSKIIAMKKALGMTDKEIEENFASLRLEKQLVAVSDMFAEMVSAENPPVGIKSPLKLKSDADAEQQIASGMPSQNAADGEGLAQQAPAPGGAPVDEAPANGEPPPEEGGEEQPVPTFGL